MDIKLNNMKDWKDVLYDSMEDKTDNFKIEQINIKGIKKVKTPLNLKYAIYLFKQANKYFKSLWKYKGSLYFSRFKS